MILTRRLVAAMATAACLMSPSLATAQSTCDMSPTPTTSIATGNLALACGHYNTATADDAIAIGNANTVDANLAMAFGYANFVEGQGSTAMGSFNYISGLDSFVVGDSNDVTANRSHVFGSNNRVSSASSPSGSTIFGNNNTVTDPSTVFGNFNTASGGLIVGSGNTSTASGTMTFGTSNTVSAEQALAVGDRNTVSGFGSVALGSRNQVSSDYSVALGYGSTNDRDNTISVGSAGGERQITFVAAGTEDHDAVNLAQLYPLANALGGGAGMLGGVFTAPTYSIQGASYNNVGSAFSAVDEELASLWDAIADVEQAVAPDPNAVAYDSADHDQLTLDGANGTRISNVAAGTSDTDAANVGQVRQGDAATLASANTYTDQRFATLNLEFSDYRNQVDQRLDIQDARISRVGAMASAMANMTASAAGVRSPNRVAVGAGNYRGENAFAVGYQRAISDRAVFTIGGAFNGEDSTVGAGAAIGW